MEEFVEIIGKRAGPTSVILAGVHGDERGGIEALKKIIPTLQIDKGRVFLGYGNPRAIEQNRRLTEVNLNRMFKADSLLTNEEKNSYEYERAQFIKKYLDQADALLDLHASSILNSKTFIICEANANSIAEFFSTDLVVSGFDELEPGGTDYYMNCSGKIGICLECGYTKDQKSITVAEENIFAFLKARGHIVSDLATQKKFYVQMNKKYFTKTNNFILSKQFENFETVEENQLIGIDGQEEVRSGCKGIILFAHSTGEVGSEAFLLGKEKENLV